ncbi:MAG: amidase family protein [Gammaproteobacteria bacterium]
MAGLPTTCSSKVRHDHKATDDAAVVERYRQAGAIIVGKTHTHLVAYGIVTPTTRRQVGRGHIPAVPAAAPCRDGRRARLLVASAPTRAARSHIPAALCGIVGLKPSYGRVSRFGVASLSWSLDHVGPMTRTVEDAALMLNVLAGYDPRDPGSVAAPVPDYTQELNDGVRGLQIGVPSNFYFDAMDADTQRLCETAFQKCWNRPARRCRRSNCH